MSPAKLTASLGGLFGLVTVWLVLRMASADTFRDPGGAVFMALLALWTVSPYALLAAAARFGRFRTATWGSPAVLILLGCYGNLAYADVNFHFWSESDAQEGLVFVFMPLLQNIVAGGATGVLLAVGIWLNHREKKAG